MKSTTSRLFRLAKRLSHKNIRGFNLLQRACLPCWANQIITYPLSAAISLAVPIGRKEHCWDLQNILEYEHDLVVAFCAALSVRSSVTLFDCGADIGLFSAVVCSRGDRIARVLAFEPNPEVREIFYSNVASLPNGEAHALAISNFEGFGKLERPNYASWSDHARYLVPAPVGLPVTTIDSFKIFGGDIAIKIDVEGGELEVLQGAKETIRHASHCVLTLEAHPQVYERTGVGPSAGMEFLESIRPCRFMVAETGQWVKSTDVIIDPKRVLNVLAITT